MKSRLRTIAESLREEVSTYRLALRHPRTPWLAKACFWLAIGYLLLPFDLIPDFIPVLGQLDDLIVVPGLIYLGLGLTPSDVIEQCRLRARENSTAR